MGRADYPVTHELLREVYSAEFRVTTQILFSHFPLHNLKPSEYNQQQHLFYETPGVHLLGRCLRIYSCFS